MPLSDPPPRREIHQRTIRMQAYARDDGLFDIEAHLVDTKPFTFQRISAAVPLSAGRPLHDLWVRMTVDLDYVVRGIEAASDVTPWGICKQAEATLAVLIGERIERGWAAKVKELLRGAASCTHLMEVLLPLASTALQGMRAVHPDRKVGAEAIRPVIDSCYAYGRDREIVQSFLPSRRDPADGH